MRGKMSAPFLLSLALLAAPASARAGGDDAAQQGPDAAATAAAVERAHEVEAEVAALAAKTSPCYLLIGGGSGVLISADGWGLTNHHVISTHTLGKPFWVRRGGGQPLRCKVVGIDPRGDIALVKCDPPRTGEALPFLPLADSDALEIGDVVIALGNPYGFAQREAEPTVTLGIVSAVHAYRQNYNDAIQTDAAINPGNSGGPLINRAGEVVGINGRVAVRFGNRMNTGVGYAIPANQIRRFLPALKAGGTAAHGWIPGLTLVDTEDGGGAGARVEEVASDSLAERLGLAQGDVIVRIDERTIRSPSGYFAAIGCYPAGDTVALVVRRGSEERTLQADLPPLGQRLPSAPVLGVRVRAPKVAPTETPEDGATPPGAEVLEAVEGGPAAKAGVKVGDVIVEIAGKPVNEVDDIGVILSELKAGAGARIVVVREGKRVEVRATLAKAP